MLYEKEQGPVCLEAFQGHGKQNPPERLRCSCVLGWRETSWLTPPATPSAFPVATFPALGPFPQHTHPQPAQCPSSQTEPPSATEL